MSDGRTQVSSDAVASEQEESLVGKKKMSITEVKNPKMLLLWVWEDKTGRWPILLFLGGFLLAFILAIIALIDYESVYATAGIACLIIAGYAAFHFKTLMALREQVLEFDRLNNKFKQENTAMRQEVDKLKHATEELNKQEEKLEEVNEKSKANLKRFSTIEKNLETLGQSNVSGMKNILGTLGSLNTRLSKNLHESTRSLYLRVFDEMEFKDDEAGMTETEYVEFLNCLPADHKRRLETEFTFEQLAGDDGKVDIEEFSGMLDKMTDNRSSANPL